MSKITFTTSEHLFGFMKERSRKMIANGAGIAGLIVSNTLLEAVYGSFIPSWFKPYVGLVSAYAGLSVRSITRDYLDQKVETTQQKIRAMAKEE